MSSPSRPAETAQSKDDPNGIAELVKRCSTLCAQAERTVDGLSGERESFLTDTLGTALQQLELILRVVGEERKESTQPEEKQGLLRRLFGRTDGGAQQEDEESFAPPAFDVALHGFQGNSWSISLAELLGFLAGGRKTGVLWIDSPHENFLVGLAEGQLMHASSDRTPEGLRLGEVLVGLGFMTRRQLERFVTQQQSDVATVSGETLLASGMISGEELHSALTHQVQQLFYRLVHTHNAVFRWREGMQVMLSYQVSLNVNQLLLDSARVQDERGNPGLRDAARQDSWNSWTEEISSKVAPPAEEAAQSTTEGDTHDAEKSEPKDTAKSESTAESEAEPADEVSGKTATKDEPGAAAASDEKSQGAASKDTSTDPVDGDGASATDTPPGLHSKSGGSSRKKKRR